MTIIERYSTVTIEPSFRTPSTIETIADAADLLFRLGLGRAAQEELWVVTVDGERNVRAVVQVAKGGYHDADVSMPALLSPVFLSATDRFIVAHNHPSGATEPTSMDLDLTASISDAADLLDLSFEDHLILTPDGHWYSLRGHGQMERKRTRRVKETR